MNDCTNDYGKATTHPAFWDCSCEGRYIHSKADRLACPVCGETEGEMPDSMVVEVERGDCFWQAPSGDAMTEPEVGAR